jgi:hypothetical protein
MSRYVSVSMGGGFDAKWSHDDAAWSTHLDTGYTAGGPESQTRGERRVGVHVATDGHRLVHGPEGGRTLRL